MIPFPLANSNTQVISASGGHISTSCQKQQVICFIMLLQALKEYFAAFAFFNVGTKQLGMFSYATYVTYELHLFYTKIANRGSQMLLSFPERSLSFTKASINLVLFLHFQYSADGSITLYGNKPRHKPCLFYHLNIEKVYKCSLFQ